MSKSVGKYENNCGMKLLGLISTFLLICVYNWEIGLSSTGFIGWLAYLMDYSIAFIVIIASFSLYKASVSSSARKSILMALRTLWPIVVWTLIYWGIFKLVDIFLEPGYGLSWKSVLRQIITGSNPMINPDMWVLNLILIIGLLFMLLMTVSNKVAMAVMWIVTAVVLVLCVFNLWPTFDGAKESTQLLLKKVPAMITYMCAGTSLAHAGIYKDLKKHWIIAQLASLAMTILMRYLNPFGKISGLDFSLLDKAFVGIFVVSFMYYVPFDKFSKSVQEDIDAFIGCSLGVFCLQHLIGVLFHYFVTHRSVNLEAYTLLDSTLIFVICFLISLIISKIPSKLVKLLVE